MPRPQRNNQSRDRLGPYATPITLPQPAYQAHSRTQDHFPFLPSRHHTHTYLPRVPNSIRPLLSSSPRPPHYSYMSRPGHQGSARPSGSGSSSSAGNSYGYPAYSAQGVSFADGAALYTSAGGPHVMQSAYANSGNQIPYAHQSQPQYPQAMHSSESAVVNHSRNASNNSPPLASSSTKAQQQLLGDDGDDDGDAAGKRRRVQRACDVCRRKKVRCDGPQQGKGACTNCITYGQVCRFEEATKRRAPPRSYTEALETRMEKVEQLLSELAPGIDFSDRIGLPVRLPDDPPKDQSKSGSPSRPQFVKPPPVPEPSEPARSVLPIDVSERDSMIARLGGKLCIKSEDSDEDDREREDDDESLDSYSHVEDVAYVSSRAPAGTLERLSPPRLLATPSAASEHTGAEGLSDEQRGQAASFIGNSSAFHLIPALERMNKKTETELSAHLASNVVDRVPQFPGMRPEFWAIPRCLTVSLWDDEEVKEFDIIRQVWPEPDLEQKLVDAYFLRPHNDYPVLSEPQFRADLKDPNKRQNREWVMLAMSVFAVASLYCDDERVLEKSYQEDALHGTRGARWYNTCRRIGFRLTWPSPSLSHTQFMLLIIVYLLGTHLAQSVAWSFLGTVFRLLQFAGAHRKITAARLKYPLHIEEAWRRVWWTAYSLDREMATMFGRPVAVQDEDFDIDPPLPLDDYLLMQGRSADGKLPKQPADMPPRIDGFACRLKLDEIVGKTLRTIYAIGKAKASRGIAGKGWDQVIVADLDSMLNQWLDTVPAHLRYDPDEPNEEHLIQSTQLHAKYYYAQILVHRPFIVGPRVNSSLNFPSLAIVTNAARLAAQMLHNLSKRGVVRSAGLLATTLAFECGCVLQLVRWGSKRSGLRTSSGAMDDINKCLEILKGLEDRWPLGGKLYDLLRILLKASDTGDDEGSVDQMQAKRKAGKEGDGAAAAADTSTEDINMTARPVVGLHRSRHLRNSSAERRKDSISNAAFTLPLSTQDLGVTPITSTPEVSSEDASPASVAAHPAPGSELGVQSGRAAPSQAQPSSSSTSASALWSRGQATQPASAMNQQPYDRRQQRFIESLPSLHGSNDGGASGTPNFFDAPFPSPLDLPTFSSALFAQGGGGGGANATTGAPSSGFATGYGNAGTGGGDGNPSLTPGFSNFFGSTGLTPFVDYGVGGGGGMDQQRAQPQHQVSYTTQDSDQAPTDQQQQQQSGMGGEDDPFGYVFRDLWAAQDYFTEAGAGGVSGPNLQF